MGQSRDPCGPPEDEALFYEVTSERQSNEVQALDRLSDPYGIISQQKEFAANILRSLQAAEEATRKKTMAVRIIRYLLLKFKLTDR